MAVETFAAKKVDKIKAYKTGTMPKGKKSSITDTHLMMGWDIFGGLARGFGQHRQNQAQLAIERMQIAQARIQTQNQLNQIEAQEGALVSQQRVADMQAQVQGSQATANVQVQQAASDTSIGDVVAASNIQTAIARQQIQDAAEERQFSLSMQRQQVQQEQLHQEMILKHNAGTGKGAMLEGILGGTMKALFRKSMLGI